MNQFVFALQLLRINLPYSNSRIDFMKYLLVNYPGIVHFIAAMFHIELSSKLSLYYSYLYQTTLLGLFDVLINGYTVVIILPFLRWVSFH